MFCYRDDLFVKVSMCGMHCDTLSHTSQTIYNSGRLVVDKSYSFPVSYPELALLTVSLMDADLGQKDCEELGYSCLPVSSLNEGSYKLPMKRPNMMPLAAGMADCWIKVKLQWESRCTDIHTAATAAAAGDKLIKLRSHRVSLSGLPEERHADLVKAHL
ncbi:MAG: hypothetical protein WDW36_002148 [Sanguina aurantia]